VEVSLYNKIFLEIRRLTVCLSLFFVFRPKHNNNVQRYHDIIEPVSGARRSPSSGDPRRGIGET